MDGRDKERARGRGKYECVAQRARSQLDRCGSVPVGDAADTSSTPASLPSGRAHRPPRRPLSTPLRPNRRRTSKRDQRDARAQQERSAGDGEPRARADEPPIEVCFTWPAAPSHHASQRRVGEHGKQYEPTALSTRKSPFARQRREPVVADQRQRQRDPRHRHQIDSPHVAERLVALCEARHERTRGRRREDDHPPSVARQRRERERDQRCRDTAPDGNARRSTEQLRQRGPVPGHLDRVRARHGPEWQAAEHRHQRRKCIEASPAGSISLAVTMTRATWPMSSIRRKPSASTPPRANRGRLTAASEAGCSPGRSLRRRRSCDLSAHSCRGRALAEAWTGSDKRPGLTLARTLGAREFPAGPADHPAPQAIGHPLDAVLENVRWCPTEA